MARAASILRSSIVVRIILLLALRRCAHLGLCPFPDFYHRPHRVFTCYQLDVHVIMDNLSTHKGPTVTKWFACHPRFHPHFTPTYSSWLNLVERWFGLLEQRKIKRGSHKSTRALRKAIQEYLDYTNDNPRPFVWTKTADQIL